MSEIIEVVQKQDLGSELITLFDLEYADGSFAYFTSNYDSGTIQFRDSSGTAQTYISLPIAAEGFDISSDGSYSRPILTVANIQSTFSDAIGMEYEELIGRRITRRLTLKKYLVGESGDTGAGNPPVEYPKTTYVIDRIKDRNVLQIAFELAAPFDIAGITVPRRQIISGGCPWKYQAASPTVAEQNKVGGCNWHAQGAYRSGYIYVNQKDEYIVSSALTFTTFSSSATAGSYYKTVKTGLTQVNSSGEYVTPSTTVYDYWQCLADTSSTPSDTSSDWRRVRIYYGYSAASDYLAFTDTAYNEYTLYNNILWKVKTLTQDASAHNSTPDYNNYWTRGDACGKRVSSCSKRFHATPDGSGGVEITTTKETALPFGGFPASRTYK